MPQATATTATKTCPQCQANVPAADETCWLCYSSFPSLKPSPKTSPTAPDFRGIVQAELIQDYAIRQENNSSAFSAIVVILVVLCGLILTTLFAGNSGLLIPLAAVFTCALVAVSITARKLQIVDKDFKWLDAIYDILLSLITTIGTVFLLMIAVVVALGLLCMVVLSGAAGH